GPVNSTFGCDTLPGECKRTNATAPPSTTSRTATATSTRRSQGRETGLGIAGNASHSAPSGPQQRICARAATAAIGADRAHPGAAGGPAADAPPGRGSVGVPGRGSGAGYPAWRNPV